MVNSQQKQFPPSFRHQTWKPRRLSPIFGDLQYEPILLISYHHTLNTVIDRLAYQTVENTLVALYVLNNYKLKEPSLDIRFRNSLLKTLRAHFRAFRPTEQRSGYRKIRGKLCVPC